MIIGWEPKIKKRVNYLRCIEGKGVYERHFGVFHNLTRQLFLYHRIIFVGRFYEDMLHRKDDVR